METDNWSRCGLMLSFANTPLGPVGESPGFVLAKPRLSAENAPAAGRNSDSFNFEQHWQ